jgi:hypothetical protein
MRHFAYLHAIAIAWDAPHASVVPWNTLRSGTRSSRGQVSSAASESSAIRTKRSLAGLEERLA